MPNGAAASTGCDKAPPPPPLNASWSYVKSISLPGGLFNQLWALQGLVLLAAEQNLVLIAPYFYSHLSSNSMGVKVNATNRPLRHAFSELFEFDCFAAALRRHGVLVLEKTPPEFSKRSGVKLLSAVPNVLLTRYKRYLNRRHRGEVAAQPIEDAVYRSLRPSARLVERSDRFLAEHKLRGADYGCVHARIENDMRRWWYHVGKVRPLNLEQILELLGSIERLKLTAQFFVAVGSDLRTTDEALLRHGLTQWRAKMIRRAVSGDGTGGVIVRGDGVAASGSLTYIESAIVDFTVCRQAAWFVGWTSSSFSASVAHYRHLDHPSHAGGGDAASYYAYCSGETLNAAPSISKEAPAEYIRVHTCKRPKGAAADRRAGAGSANLTSSSSSPSSSSEDEDDGRGLATAAVFAASPPTPTLSVATSSPSSSPASITATDNVAQLSSLLDASAANDEERIAELFRRFDCKHVYLDVGSNVGVQIRKLYEPQKYPKAAATHAVYQRFFGSVENKERCGVCAIGVEPNPHHAQRLSMLERRLRAAGAGVLILHAAAGASDGVAHLALGHAAKKDPWEDLGASASEAWRGLRRAGNPKALTVPVRSLDLSRIVHAVHHQLVEREATGAGAAGGAAAGASKGGREGKVLMKLDVEGLEFAVLPAMVRSQALCTIDAMRVEWHTRFWGGKVAAAAAEAKNLSARELIEADDESYMHDRQPWPTAPICPATAEPGA